MSITVRERIYTKTKIAYSDFEELVDALLMEEPAIAEDESLVSGSSLCPLIIHETPLIDRPSWSLLPKMQTTR